MNRCLSHSNSGVAATSGALPGPGSVRGHTTPRRIDDQRRNARPAVSDVEDLVKVFLAMLSPKAGKQVHIDLSGSSGLAVIDLPPARAEDVADRYRGAKKMSLCLPGGLDQLPPWLWCLPQLTELSVSDYRSSILNLQGMNELAVVKLQRTAPRPLTVIWSGRQALKVFFDSVEAADVTWLWKEDPDDGLDDDPGSFHDDGRMPDRSGAVEPLPSMMYKGPPAELSRPSRLQVGPFVSLPMGRGIIAYRDLRLVVTALYTCSLLVMTDGRGVAAYHYPAGTLDDLDVQQSLENWAAGLCPERIVLVSAPDTGDAGLDEAGAADRGRLLGWVRNRLGVEPALQIGVCPAVCFEQGAISVGSFNSVIGGRSSLCVDDGVDTGTLAVGNYKTDGFTEDVLLFGSPL